MKVLKWTSFCSFGFRQVAACALFAAEASPFVEFAGASHLKALTEVCGLLAKKWELSAYSGK